MTSSAFCYQLINQVAFKHTHTHNPNGQVHQTLEEVCDSSWSEEH